METLGWALLAFVLGYLGGFHAGRKSERRKLIHKAAAQVALAIRAQGPAAGILKPPVDYPAQEGSERTH